MMPSIAMSEFARKQHTENSGRTYFKGSEEELLKLVGLYWNYREPGFGRSTLDEVVTMSVPVDNFVGTTVSVDRIQKQGVKIQAKLEKRQENEEAHIVHYVSRSKQSWLDEDPVKYAKIVLYSRKLLPPEDLNGTGDAEWIVVALIASDVENEPMHPVAMSRNFLKKTGGTFAPYTACQFAEAIWYWSQHCRIEP